MKICKSWDQHSAIHAAMLFPFICEWLQRCDVYSRCIVNEFWPGLSEWFVQDDVSVGEGWGEHAEDEVTHTRFSSHSSRNCWNFWDISSWALPTALRILPRTAERHRRTCMHTHTHTPTQCNYSQDCILQACCTTNRGAALVMQQKRMD